MLARIVVMLAVIAALMTGGALWLLRTAPGTATLLQWLPGLRVVAPQGALWGDFSADRIEVELSPAVDGKPGDHVVVTGLQWRGLTLDLRTWRTPWLSVGVDALAADAIDYTALPKPDAVPSPFQAPANLKLPVNLRIDDLRVGAIRATALGDTPLRDVHAKVRLNAGDTQHLLDDLSVSWGAITATGSIHAGVEAPMPIEASLQLRQDAPPAAAPGAASAGTAAAPSAAASAAAPTGAASAPAGQAIAWSAAIAARGPIDRIDVTAALRASGQSLDAKVTALPFAAWPLGDLQASVSNFDASAIVPGAPRTALSGHAQATSTGLGEPVGVQLDLSNAAAGRWNEGKLPLARIVLSAQARPSDRSTVELHAFNAELGTPQAPGGRIAGSGQWHAGEWSLDASLDQIEPASLDARMADMKLSGPLRLAGHGFTAGPSAAPGAAPASSASSTPTAPSQAVAASPTVDIGTQLQGRVQLPGGTKKAPAGVRAVELRLDASGNERRIEIRKAEAKSGDALASLTGLATRTESNNGWRIDSRLSLARFDPAPWWPGQADAVLRSGPHRLNAQAHAKLELLDLALAGSPPGKSPLASLSGVHGDVTLDIAPSTLAGVPIEGKIALARPANARDLKADVRLTAGSSRVAVNGQMAATGNGATDRWTLDLKIPALAELAPLTRLATPAGAPVAMAGQVNANMSVDGRWPALSTTGMLAADGLRYGDTSVVRANAQWQLGTRPDAPLELQAAVQQLASGPQRLDTATLQLKGTAASHTLAAEARAPALPPQWVDALRGQGVGMRTTSAGAVPPAAGASTPAPASSAASAGRGTVAVVAAQGGITGDVTKANGAIGWKGRLLQAQVADSSAPQAPWAHVDPVDIDVAGGETPRADVSAGSAALLGARMRWRQLAWQGGAQPKLDADAALDPLAVAPILARLQPDFGWSGDLSVSARVQVHTASRVAVGMELKRESGDLRISDKLGDAANPSAPVGTIQLGLSQIRIAVDANDGVWRFTQSLASSNFGNIEGTQTVRTSPQAVWPAPDAPIEGSVTARVDQLSSLSPWVPVNWRVSGRLNAQARIGGQFGAPEYTGVLTASDMALRNLLEGVALSDGDVRIALKGTSATIERFHVVAGKGTADVTGAASFGSAPSATLKLAADHFQVLGRVDRRIVVSGGADVKLDAQRMAVNGAFKLDEGLFDFTRSDAPSLSDDVTVTRLKPGQQASVDEATSQPAVNRNVAIDVKLDLGDKLRIKGRGIDTGLGGDLRITSPDGVLAVNGTIGTIGGTYQAYGQNLAIDRGVFIFNGPPGNPRLDIEATRPDIDTRVGVQVTGYALTPRVRLFSDSTMSDTDKLSWLILGKAPDSLGRNDAALLQRAAMGLLAGEGGSSNSLVKSLGLDDLSLGQQTDDSGVKQTVVSMGKQLSKRWYVGYERSLSGTAGGWQLIYRAAQRFTLRATAGVDSSVDVIWTWRWN